jgi:hypothetical protein
MGGAALTPAYEGRNATKRTSPAEDKRHHSPDLEALVPSVPRIVPRPIAGINTALSVSASTDQYGNTPSSVYSGVSEWSNCLHFLTLCNIPTLTHSPSGNSF